MYKRLLIILPFILFLTTSQNFLIKDNVFSPYSWATYYAVKRTILVTKMVIYLSGTSSWCYHGPGSLFLCRPGNVSSKVGRSE
jgi:hypothetical protein